jgi:3'(2'), 5'-bisphosphate nucleotidase
VKTYLNTAIKSAVEAGIAIMAIYEEEVEVALKADNSPLTAADLASNRVINAYLKETDIPVISEENRQHPWSERRTWKRCWVVDPLDGTKEFIKKNGEFTVNIAICEDQAPILGVIYVPVTRELYYAEVADGKAYKTVLGKDHSIPGKLFSDTDAIQPGRSKNGSLRIVGSRSHMNEDTQNYIDKVRGNGKEVEIVSKGSSLKFCLVAEGKADLYPRFAPTMEWDTAAGHAICKAVGLKVTSRQTEKELQYNKEDLLNPYFLVE